MDHARLDKAVAKFREGDSDAFDIIHECTEQAFYYTALRITGDEYLADDVLQEAYLTIFTKIDTLQHNKAFLNWAKQIVANKALDMCRSEGREAPLADEELNFNVDQAAAGEYQEFLPETVLTNQAKQQEILDIVNALPDYQRSAVYMHYFQELSVKAIAAAMACSENTVKSRLDQGRKKIRCAVEEEERKGNKLYSVTLTPVLGILLRMDMEKLQLSGPGLDAIRTYIAGHADGAVAAEFVQEGAFSNMLDAGAGAESTVGAATETMAVSGAAKTAAGMTLLQKVGVGLLAAAVAGGGVAGLRSMNKGQVVNWSDPAMEQMVRIAIEMPEGDIHTKDLEGITELMILADTHAKTNKNPEAFQLDRLIGYDSYIIGGVEYTEDGEIVSLDDLKAFPDLTSVTICYNSVEDLSGLAELEGLTHVDLYDNRIQDLTPLAEMNELVFVAVGANEITDLSPLSGLTNLEQLYFFVNQVDDVSPLANLTKLREVGASSNQIKDITPLRDLTSLTYLDLKNNPIEDWSVLNTLPEDVIHGRP